MPRLPPSLLFPRGVAPLLLLRPPPRDQPWLDFRALSAQRENWHASTTPSAGPAPSSPFEELHSSSGQLLAAILELPSSAGSGEQWGRRQDPQASTAAPLCATRLQRANRRNSNEADTHGTSAKPNSQRRPKATAPSSSENDRHGRREILREPLGQQPLGERSYWRRLQRTTIEAHPTDDDRAATSRRHTTARRINTAHERARGENTAPRWGLKQAADCLWVWLLASQNSAHSAAQISPPLDARMSLSFLDHLASRLRIAEDSYLLGRPLQAQEQAQDVIRDLASLTSTSRRLTSKDHACADGCVCEAAMILLIQCIADAPSAAGAPDRDSQMSELVTTYYSESRLMPYAVFVVWIQWHLSGQHYELACRELIAYLDSNYATSSDARSRIVAVESPKGEAGIHSAAGGLSADARYTTLLELLLFHTLVPLSAHEEALAFLRKGKRSRAARGGSGAPQRDERLSPETKERWMGELLELQAQGFTHALAAARQVAAAEAHSTAAALAPIAAAPSASAAGFRAGLHAMHESTAYALSAPSPHPSQQWPLPANLPDSTALVQPSLGRSEEHIESNDSSSAASGSDSYYSAALLPTGPLLPWMSFLGSSAPSASAAATASGGTLSSGGVGAWSWSGYLVSCFHRLYFALHPWAPRLANLLRGACSWTWARRGLWTTLLLLYLGGRLLSALLRFFRLTDLPGVRLIVGEIRNFIRIAFISGTGRSLFA